MKWSEDAGGMFTQAGERVPLEGVAIEGEVLGGHAHVRVRQTYRNREARAVESVYTFPLPADATLAGFRMTCGGRVVEGIVQEREQAFRTYDDAIVSGHGAALLEQDRKNVFTASVGNLLPLEETIVEVEYVQRLSLDEGSLRVMIPTLVAPRYIPGQAQATRSAHGHAEPTATVPDADRITPKIGPVSYAVTLDLLLDLGRAVLVSSPSHAVISHAEGQGRTRVSFAAAQEALDRDIVLDVRGAGSEQLSAVCVHKRAESDGYLALSVLPDLLALSNKLQPQDVTFVIDVSGSMQGESLAQAQAALRLCLRHLRESDRFNILAFSTTFTALAGSGLAFTQQNLERADVWVSRLVASGGTEMLAPLEHAVRASPSGIIVLLTDGQVGNEQQILESVLKLRAQARVYSFGIGTNVSDQLLRDLARETRGAVEFVHPGERIESKVVAQFARALAPRVEDLSLRFEGVDVVDMAPGELPALVDAEPWVVYGRYERGGEGRAVVTGRVGAVPFELRVPLSLAEQNERPSVAKLWATERIADFERQKLEGRRADAMRARIIALSTEHGVSSQYTSFVVVERRSGDRRAQGGAGDTRVVPVNAPAGWASHGGVKREAEVMFGGLGPPALQGAPMKKSAPRGGAMGPPPPPSPASPASYGAPMGAPPGGPPPAPMAPSPARAQRMVPAAPPAFFEEKSRAASSESAKAKESGSLLSRAKGWLGLGASEADDAPMDAEESLASFSGTASRDESPRARTPEGAVQAQLASGLWDDASTEAALRHNALTLWALVEQGVDSTHAMYGTPVKKAVEAILLLLDRVGFVPDSLRAMVLAVAWLASSGRRTRGSIETRAAGVSELSLGDEREVRAWLVDAVKNS
ncbi:MAG: VIT domain-containing protein [Deltaproteobacteria bacterium]|nr:VIT domain-containing protein [Deltaproteobacteria bacterium]